MQIKVKKVYLLLINIFIIVTIIFFVLPKFNIGIINHNIAKNIDANVYLYTEIEIKNEWSKK